VILSSDLQEIIKSQINSIPTSGSFIQRSIINQIDPFIPFAIVLSGIRRCGKSTFLFQLLNKYDSLNYLNFEDPRLVNFDLTDFEKVEKIFNFDKNNSNIYFFDEIQNVEKWELYIRSLIDRKKACDYYRF